MKKSTAKQNTKLWDNVLSAMQNYYRAFCLPCVGKSKNCSGQATVMHHWFTSGNCTALRLEHRNLVPLCAHCHASVHKFNQETAFNIRKAMEENYGSDWEDKLVAKKRDYKLLTPLETQDYLKQNLKYYNENTN